MGIFGKLFGFNSNGKAGAGERTSGCGTFAQAMDYETNNSLASAGIEPASLDSMGYSEQVASLESAGLNPSDFGL